jgi:hypothetical protein
LTNLNENINYTVVISIDAGEFFESASATLQKKLDRCFVRIQVIQKAVNPLLCKHLGELWTNAHSH